MYNPETARAWRKANPEKLKQYRERYLDKKRATSDQVMRAEPQE